MSHQPRGQKAGCQKAGWRISVLRADGQELLFHARCEDRIEIRCLATEARHLDRRCQIWIRDPFGDLQSWD